MTRFTLIILILLSLIAGDCSSRKNKMDKRNLIPDKELVSILTEIHIADGLLILSRTRDMFSSYDTISPYSIIIKKHGYTKETMDSTMKYYFTNDPTKLIKIYDQVLGILSEMESLVDKEDLQAEQHRNNFWTGEEFYSFPDPLASDSAKFNITLSKAGVYVLSYSVILFPDDQSVNPRLTAYSCHPDSLETGKRNYLKTINYIKDGQPHTYTFNIKVSVNSSLNFKGWFYDFDNHPEEWEKHMIIENISFTSLQAAL